eukprot:1166877-Lingulodinium_polyedra.AAC.1
MISGSVQTAICWMMSYSRCPGSSHGRARGGVPRGPQLPDVDSVAAQARGAPSGADKGAPVRPAWRQQGPRRAAGP